LKRDLKILTVIQARTKSTRLPGKVLLPLAGKELLIRIYERVNSSPLAGRVVIAIPDTPDEYDLFDFCKTNNLEVFRGHPTNLLDRHYRAGLHYEADAVVKIPSDCPLIDPKIITKVLDFFIVNRDYDYVSNLHPATYPDGNDVEILTIEALKICHDNSIHIWEREHTTPYVWEHPELFRIGNVIWETGLDYSMQERWTIDYPEDYLFIKEIYNKLYVKNPVFGINDILELLAAEPALRDVNKKYLGVNWYRNHLNELKTIGTAQTRSIDEN
jgi:spore coat polysaccharide biosynthesis protein SpsF